MKIPVFRHFDPNDIIGEFDSDTMKITFMNHEDFTHYGIALGYSLHSDGSDNTTIEHSNEAIIHTISLIYIRDGVVMGKQT